MRKTTIKLGMALIVSSVFFIGGYLRVNAVEDKIPADAAEFHGHYYYVYDNKDYTYEQALEFCVEAGGYLATITTQEENDFLFQYMKDSGYESAYFGLSDASEEGTWAWINGEAVEYTNWSTNEPNAEREGEDYAMFYFKYSTGAWNDGDFGSGTVNGGKAFICEWGESVIDASDKGEQTKPGVCNGHHYSTYGSDFTNEPPCTAIGGHHILAR